jgi:peptide/nickel transport system substrate-binding protein
MPILRTHSTPAAVAGLGRRSFLGLSLGAGAALALAACGGNASPTTAGGTNGTLKWGWALPTSWDPVTSSAGWDVHVLSLTYAALTRLDEKGDPVPALAESWKYDTTGSSVTFTLRKGLTFSDGTVLNVTVELAQPDFQIPALLAGKTGMVVNPKVFEADAASIAIKPAGAGPFTLTSYVQNSKAVLRRSPSYWDAKQIKVENFEVYPLPEATTVVAALQSGQYNVAQIPGSQVAAAKAAGLKVQVIPSLVVAVLDVNIKEAPFTDPDVALALKYAVDREELLKTAAFGYGEVAYQPFPKGYVGHNDELDGLYAYNPAKAKELLAKAGHAGGLELTITTSQAQGIPELLQAQLKKVGITAKIETIPAAQATQIIYVQHSKALFTDQFAGRDSAVQAFQVLFGDQGLMNPGRTTSPELQKALDAVRGTPLDSADYPKALQAATAIAVKAQPNVFLYTVPRILARGDKVSEIPGYTVVQRFEGVTAS